MTYSIFQVSDICKCRCVTLRNQENVYYKAKLFYFDISILFDIYYDMLSNILFSVLSWMMVEDVIKSGLSVTNKTTIKIFKCKQK